jgi:two-component system chemotaxis response regulator CheB
LIRVLIAEDSPTTRQFLVEALSADPDIAVIATASNGAEAIDLVVELRPDLIVMDVHMPIADGLEATKAIMGRVPTPIIIISSATRTQDVELSLTATQAGALMALPKPTSASENDEFSAQLVSMAKAMAQVKVVRRWGGPKARSPVTPPRHRPGASRPIRLVAIAASTGGPAALRRILDDLPRDFPAPILVVQHIARGFATGFAEWLGGGSRLRVKVAEGGEPLLAGTVYVAAEDGHLGASSSGTVALSTVAPIGGFRPSATWLFDSVGHSFGPSAAAVVLTGMGRDGVDGLETIRAAGGRVIAQDEASSVVYGMAQEAVNRDLADVVLPLDEIAPCLLGLVMADGDVPA